MYNLIFDTLVIDCEGCYESIFKDGIDSGWLNQIRKIIIEWDGEFMEKLLIDNGFKLIDYKEHSSLPNGVKTYIKLVDKSYSLNAIVVLTRGYNNKTDYKDLIKRNNSISQQKWWYKYDYIIFHEGNIPLDHQNYIKKMSGNITSKLRFINVKESFDTFKNCDNINIDICPVSFMSKSFNCGYKAMCNFWFIDFIKYCYNYNYILRIDEDCFLNEDQKDPKNSAVIASPYWYGMDDPNVIKGMQKFFSNLANSEQGITYKWHDIKEWESPYTNVLWISIKWAMSKEIQYIQNSVKQSKCISSNRWGDLALWGAVCHLLNINHKTISLSYYHKSHNKNISNMNVFDDIYINKVWGVDENGEGISGSGSKVENNIKYLNFLNTFIKINKIKSIVDLGCGDWQLMSKVNLNGIKYDGYDNSNIIIDKINKL